MISWKLMKANKKNNKGILLAIVLCVIVLIVSLMYIQHSLKISDNKIEEKFGKIDAVVYDNDGTQNMLNTISKIKGVKHFSWQARISAITNNQNAILHVVDFEDNNIVNDMKNISGDVVKSVDGIFATKDSLERLQIDGDKVEIDVNGEISSMKVAEILDENSFYEVGSLSQNNLYISKEYYEKTFTQDVLPNVYLIDFGDVSSTKVSSYLQNFKNVVYNNILDEIDLDSKESTQSFLYAVSFILVGLIGIVLGGLYNFCKITISNNIENIGFFRTLGLSHKGATILYQLEIVWLGIISEIVGVCLGFLLGNIIIFIKYGFTHIVFPSSIAWLLSMLISIVLPYVFMVIETGKYKSEKPIKLLLEYRNKGYSKERDGIKSYLISSTVYTLLFIIIYRVISQFSDGLFLMLCVIEIICIIKALEGINVVFLYLISNISNVFATNGFLFNTALRNLGRNKKKICGVLGTLILVVAFHIGMYNVFYTIRMDAVNKVQLQYNADAFISDYNQITTVINKKVEAISNMPIVKAIETSNTRYLTIDGSRIEGYFLSKEEFSTFFNFKNIETGEKVAFASNDKGTVIGESLAQKGNIQVGDTLELSDESGVFKVVVEAICDSNDYMGNVVYLNENSFSYPINTISIIFDDHVEVDKAINSVYEILGKDDISTPNISSKAKIKENYHRNAVKGTMFIEIILAFISTVGVLMLLNQVAQIIHDRKRELSMLRIMGASLNDVKFIVLLEGIILMLVGLAGSIIAGIIVTPGFVDIATYTSGIGHVLSYHYDVTTILKISAYMLVLYLICLYLIVNNFGNKSLMSGIRDE